MTKSFTSLFVTDNKETCQQRYKFICIISDMNEEFSTYRGRLNWSLKKAGMSQTDLAKLCGLKPQAVQYLCDQKNNAQGSIHNAKFAHHLKVSALWLEANIGEPLTEDRLKEVEKELEKTKEDFNKTMDTVKSWGVEDINSVDVELSEIFSSAYKVRIEDRPHVTKIVKTFIRKPRKAEG